MADYREAISQLPLNPHPNIFGLHENADIACANNETQELCDIMLSLQPKVSCTLSTWHTHPTCALSTWHTHP
eukprot:2862118-Prymnesium_polylepis.1